MRHSDRRSLGNIQRLGRLLGVLCTVLFISVLAGCGSAPVQEMSEARQAIEAARVAGAEEFASGPYLKAQAHLRVAEELLDDHHFNKARASAALARDEAMTARETAQDKINQQ